MTSTNYYYHEKKNPLSVSEYITIGTGFDLERDEALTRKRPIAIEEMTVRDSQGRRRFHGAYTGGFSAGYFNTCGSEQGWTPSEFRSTRGETLSNRITAKPEDFMDEEDLAEYGIAPRQLVTKQGYQLAPKNGNQPTTDQSVVSFHGADSIASLLGHGDNVASFDGNRITRDDSVGVRLLKSIGWKEGRGVGEMKSIQPTKTYGCALPPHLTNKNPTNQIFILPQDTHIRMPEIRTNVHGLGYVPIRGLNELDWKKADFKPTGTEKLGIRGQAFGTGVINEIEDDDEYPSNYNDVYAEDNLDNYDYTLDAAGHESSTHAASYDQLKFVPSSRKLVLSQYTYNLPKVPFDYTPRPKLGPEIIHKSSAAAGLPSQFSHPKAPANKQPMIDPLTKSMMLGDITAAEFVERRQKATLNLQPAENLVEKLGLNIKMKKFVKSCHVGDSDSRGSAQSSSNVAKTPPTTTQNVVDHMKNMDTQRQVRSGHSLVSKRVTSPWIPEKVLSKRFNVPYVELGALVGRADASSEKVHIYNVTQPNTPTNHHPKPISLELAPPDKQSGQTSNVCLMGFRGSSNSKPSNTVTSHHNVGCHGDSKSGSTEHLKAPTTNGDTKESVQAPLPPQQQQQQQQPTMERPSIDLFKAIFADDSDEE